MVRSNDAVAQMLQEFADLLGISGGELFKVGRMRRRAGQWLVVRQRSQIPAVPP
jgi:hypothetical protein